ncbi:MAG: hypothetical protein ACP5TJ_02180, partial [Candidatus Micrarchaeia archaeon]
SELENLSSYLYSVFGAPVYESNTTIIFSTVQALKNVSKTTVAYSPVLVDSYASVWQPGWLICSNPVTCNSTFQSMWWGVNPAFVEIYAPKQENLTIRMNAMSYGTTASEYIYFDDRVIRLLQLSPTPSSVIMNVTAMPGINPLVFEPVSNYQNFGVRNLTVSLQG